MLSIFTDFFKTLSSTRLKDTLKAHEMDIENTIESADARKIGPWVDKAKLSLQEAEKALENGDIEKGWRLLNEAELLAIYGYDDNRLKNAAKATLKEAKSKLKDWRKEAVQEILKEDIINCGLEAEDLFVAREILKEDNNNMHLKNNLLQGQIVVLTMIALICLLATILFLPSTPSDSILQNHSYLFIVAIFGALGGSISGVTSINKASKEEKVPEMVLNYMITVLRPVIGASSAIVVVLFLVSGLMNIGDATNLSRELLLSVAFISGFSEKLLLKIVEKTIK